LSQQPVPGTRCAFDANWSGPLRGSLFGLAPDGVFRASALALGAVGSYPTFSPLPALLAKRRRFAFLWHCPSRSLAASSPACIPLPGYAASHPLVFGLSSPELLKRNSPGAILRPSKIARSLVHRPGNGKHPNSHHGFHGPPRISFLPIRVIRKIRGAAVSVTATPLSALRSSRLAQIRSK
jgi:hypothetical protein